MFNVHDGAFSLRNPKIEEQRPDEVVYVRVSDRPLLQELARKRLEINAHFRNRANQRIQSTILSQAPHLCWTP
jgi:hypothetical protein